MALTEAEEQQMRDEYEKLRRDFDALFNVNVRLEAARQAAQEVMEFITTHDLRNAGNLGWVQAAARTWRHMYAPKDTDWQGEPTND